MDIGIIMSILIRWPFLALLLSAFFAILYFRCRRRAVLVTALAWLIYFPYEQAMQWRILCSGECNIRVDLLLLYPLLLLMSLAAVIVYVRRKDSVKRTGNQP